MRAKALKVVDAVRAMQLAQRKDRTVSELDQKSLMDALENLRKAMEEFDASTSYSNTELTPKFKPEYATPLQMADDSYVEQVLHGISEDAALNELPDAPMGMEHELEDRPKASLHLPKPVLAAAVLAHMSAVENPEPHGERKRLMPVANGMYHDGQQYVSELRIAVNGINDKLTHAVRKIGWNPRLRRLAKRLHKSQADLMVEMRNGHNYVMIPAEQWGKLSVAIAESALNQDLTVALPQPSLSRKHDLEKDRSNLPRPPSSMFDD